MNTFVVATVHTRPLFGGTLLVINHPKLPIRYCYLERSQGVQNQTHRDSIVTRFSSFSNSAALGCIQLMLETSVPITDSKLSTRELLWSPFFHPLLGSRLLAVFLTHFLHFHNTRKPYFPAFLDIDTVRIENPRQWHVSGADICHPQVRVPQSPMLLTIPPAGC